MGAGGQDHCTQLAKTHKRFVFYVVIMSRSVEQLLPAVSPGPGLGLLPSLGSVVPLVSSAVSQLLPQLGGGAPAAAGPGSSCGEGRAVLRGWLSEQHTRDLVMVLTINSTVPG